MQQEMTMPEEPEEEDWEDRELEQEEEDDSLLASDSGRPWLPWVLWALIPLALLGIWLTLGDRRESKQTAPAETPVASESPAPASVETEPGVDLPPLSESDSFVRETFARLSDRPYLAELLSVDDLVRKLVVAVANVAEGTSPRRQIAHVRPEESFMALSTSERIALDPETYHRYDAPAELFASLDSEVVAGIYRLLLPLLEEAHSELGLSDRRGFGDTLSRATGVLLEAPVVEGPIVLRAVSVSYAFEDAKLESLSPAQKHLVRMGPENTRRIQKKLRELARALDVKLPGEG
jgi:hypothetical protein